jgi:hypothetical protein
MEESPQSYSAGSRKKPRTPPLPPARIEQPGIDLGAFVPSFRGSGSALSPTEKACMAMPATRLGQHDSVISCCPGSLLDASSGKTYMHEGGLQ